MSRIKIELEKVLKERKISKNQLCYACKLQHTQLNNYCKNKVVRVDLATIAKICDYVGCSIADILVLEKDEEPEQEIAEKQKKTTDFKRSMIKKGDYYNLLINECNNLLFIDEKQYT